MMTMSSASLTPKPKKGSRVSGVNLQPKRLAVVFDLLKRADVLMRLGMCAGAIVAIWLLTSGWQRPFNFHEGDLPERAITARVPFTTVNAKETERRRDSARNQVVTIYRHKRDDVEQLRQQLINKVRQIVRAESLDALEKDKLTRGLWQDFMHGISPSKDNSQGITTNAQFFDDFRAEFNSEDDLQKYENAVKTAMQPIDDKGVLHGLQHDFDKQGGNQSQIRVITGNGAPAFVEVKEVLIENVLEQLRKDLEKNLSKTLARHTHAWFRVKGRLNETLTYDREETAAAAEAAAAAVQDVLNEYVVGQPLAPGGEPLTPTTLALLRKEYDAAAERMTLAQKLGHTVAYFGMCAAIFSVCGFYCSFRNNRVVTDTPTLFRILCLTVITIGLCRFAVGHFPEAVIIPMLLFAMTLVIAYEQELALLLSTVMALAVVVSLGLRLEEFTVYVAAMATVVLCLRHVRSRTKLIYVGTVTAAIAAATCVGSETLSDPAQGYAIFKEAAWYGFFSIMAGMLMTGLLPFLEMEPLFDIQTEQSLLELADVSHPLLQNLIRRAPGTYNHTINVASIAEAAAEAIGAHGLLVRVGAYFHDIGKMVKPSYFIENQGEGTNRHESLLPAMSTLVIIAHVKDGADLARQYNLPNVLVDFIMQHHGTTLVEYFYNRASEQRESDPDGGQVDEHSYRYPGPKPQTKEAAVLMLADTVESAGRTLTEPTPSRIENLVHELAMKKLLDGQFDECGLTLSELKKIETSLIKSLSAVYHARIKYPDSQSA